MVVRYFILSRFTKVTFDVKKACIKQLGQRV